MEEMKLDFPTLVDGLDDAVNEAYAAWPERLYLVDLDGTIAYRGGPGPRGFIPGELDSALERGMAKWPRQTPANAPMQGPRREPTQGPKRVRPQDMTREQKLELVRARRKAAKEESAPEAKPPEEKPKEPPPPTPSKKDSSR